MRMTCMEVSRGPDVLLGRPINTCSGEDEATMCQACFSNVCGNAVHPAAVLALTCSCALLIYFHLLQGGKHAFMFTFAISL